MTVLGTSGVSVNEEFLHNILKLDGHAQMEGHLIYRCDAEYIKKGWTKNAARNDSRFLESMVLQSKRISSKLQDLVKYVTIYYH